MVCSYRGLPTCCDGDAELAVALEDGAGVNEAGLGQLLRQSLPVESVMSVKVDLLGVEGAVGILVKVRDGQPTTVDQEPGATGRRDPQRTGRIVDGMRERGVLIGRTGAGRNTLKIRPPLVFGDELVHLLTDALTATLAALR